MQGLSVCCVRDGAEVVVVIVVATACCGRVATSTELKLEGNLGD